MKKRYFTTDNTEENVQREKEMGVEGKIFL